MRRWFESMDFYFYALSLASWFEVGVHWGSQYMVNREAAARFDRLNARLPGLFAASTLTLLFVFALITGLESVVVAIIGCSALARAASTLLGAICIGRGHILAPTVARILAAVVGLGGMVLWVRPEPTKERLALVIGAATIAYVAPLVVGSLRLGVRLVGAPAAWPAIWRQLATGLWPFFLLFFCGQLFYRVDPSLLEWMGPEGLVTRYGLAFKWIEGLFFLPYVVASAAIPALIRSARDGGRAAANRTLVRFAVALTAGTLATSVALLVVGQPLLLWLMGDGFAPSVPLFRWFAWLLPIHSLGVFFSAALVAQGREKLLLAITAATAMIGFLIKVPGFALVGIDAFSVGVYAGLSLHAVACAVALWRQPLEPVP